MTNKYVKELKKWVQYAANSFSTCGLERVSSAPHIFRVLYQGDRLDPFLYLYSLSSRYMNERVYYIVSFYWSVNEWTIGNIHKDLARFKRLFRKHTVIFLANSPEELELLKQNNFNAVLCNHNCFVDENIYRPLKQEKKFDAVYDARLSPFKRHQLAEKITSLGLITYIHDFSNQEEYTTMVKRKLNYAHWFNKTPDGLRHLSATEVNEALNKCKVGLCLSAEEGAMYASIQYLLAGLPVVNVPNKGGRDVFFDGYNSITVEPEAGIVAEAVKGMIDRNQDAETIRNNTIKLMEIHRNYFIDLINQIGKDEGYDLNFKEKWDSLFYNKFIRWVSYKEVL